MNDTQTWLGNTGTTNRDGEIDLDVDVDCQSQLQSSSINTTEVAAVPIIQSSDVARQNDVETFHTPGTYHWQDDCELDEGPSVDVAATSSSISAHPSRPLPASEASGSCLIGVASPVPNHLPKSEPASQDSNPTPSPPVRLTGNPEDGVIFYDRLPRTVELLSAAMSWKTLSKRLKFNEETVSIFSTMIRLTFSFAVLRHSR